MFQDRLPTRPLTTWLPSSQTPAGCTVWYSRSSYSHAHLGCQRLFFLTSPSPAHPSTSHRFPGSDWPGLPVTCSSSTNQNITLSLQVLTEFLCVPDPSELFCAHVLAFPNSQTIICFLLPSAPPEVQKETGLT